MECAKDKINVSDEEAKIHVVPGAADEIKRYLRETNLVGEPAGPTFTFQTSRRLNLPASPASKAKIPGTGLKIPKTFKKLKSH